MSSLSAYPRAEGRAADIHLDEAGNLAVVRGLEDLRQRIIERMRFFLGEWYQEQRKGVPWFGEVLLRPGDLGIAANVMSQGIATLQGLAEVIAVDLALEQSTRTLSANVHVRAEQGGLLDVAVEFNV